MALSNDVRFVFALLNNSCSPLVGPLQWDLFHGVGTVGVVFNSHSSDVVREDVGTIAVASEECLLL